MKLNFNLKDFPRYNATQKILSMFHQKSFSYSRILADMYFYDVERRWESLKYLKFQTEDHK